MSKVVISVVTAQADLPSGVSAGAKRFSIADTAGNVVQTQDVDGVEATFTGVSDGDFTASVQDLDSNGGNLGNAVTAAFNVSTVVTPPAQYAASSAVSVVVSAE